MPAPICVKCQQEMRCKKNGFVVCDPAVGNLPSTYWRGDMYECPICHTQIVTGFSKPVGPQDPGMQPDDPPALQFTYEPPKKVE